MLVAPPGRPLPVRWTECSRSSLRKERQRHFLLEEGNESLAATYFGDTTTEGDEPFAMLHRF